MKTWTGRARVAMTVSAIWLTCACTSGPGPSGGGEPPVGAIPTARDTTTLSLPLEAYTLQGDSHVTVQRASWRLTRDCVRRFGGAYTLSEKTLIGALPKKVRDNSRRYGLTDPAAAARYGYNVPPSQGRTATPAERAGKSGWTPTETERLLVRGPAEGASASVTDTTGKPLPPGGCQAEANRALAGGAAAPDEEFAMTLDRDAYRKSELDSRVRAATASWSACMEKGGRTYADIWEPNDKRWPEPATDEEIATAVADVACKQETNLIGIWFAVETAYQKQAIESRSADLDAVKAHIGTTVSNAARVVGGA